MSATTAVLAPVEPDPVLVRVGLRDLLSEVARPPSVAICVGQQEILGSGIDTLNYRVSVKGERTSAPSSQHLRVQVSSGCWPNRVNPEHGDVFRNALHHPASLMQCRVRQQLGDPRVVEDVFRDQDLAAPCQLFRSRGDVPVLSEVVESTVGRPWT